MYTHPPLNEYQNLPKNSLITTSSRIFKYLNIFKTLRNSVLHNTQGEMGLMDQLFHKASHLKAGALARVLFGALQGGRGVDQLGNLRIMR